MLEIGQIIPVFLREFFVLDTLIEAIDPTPFWKLQQ